MEKYTKIWGINGTVFGKTWIGNALRCWLGRFYITVLEEESSTVFWWAVIVKYSYGLSRCRCIGFLKISIDILCQVMTNIYIRNYYIKWRAKRRHLMNILVTGAKGMVGMALVNNLKNIRDHKNQTRPNNLYRWNLWKWYGFYESGIRVLLRARGFCLSFSWRESAGESGWIYEGQLRFYIGVARLFKKASK